MWFSGFLSHCWNTQTLKSARSFLCQLANNNFYRISNGSNHYFLPCRCFTSQTDRCWFLLFSAVLLSDNSSCCNSPPSNPHDSQSTAHQTPLMNREEEPRLFHADMKPWINHELLSCVSGGAPLMNMAVSVCVSMCCLSNSKCSLQHLGFYCDVSWCGGCHQSGMAS